MPQPLKQTNNVRPAVFESDRDAEMVPSGTTTAAPSVLSLGEKDKSVPLGLFEKQDSFPLPEGYRHVGVVFEGLTVHGAARGNQQVESFEIALLKVCHSDTDSRLVNYTLTPSQNSITDGGRLQFHQEDLQLPHRTYSPDHLRFLWCRPRGRDHAGSWAPRSRVLDFS